MKKYRLVPDWGQSERFGVNVEIDEQAIIAALSNYIGELKERYHPEKDCLYVKLVPDPASWRKEPKP